MSPIEMLYMLAGAVGFAFFFIALGFALQLKVFTKSYWAISLLGFAIAILILFGKAKGYVS